MADLTELREIPARRARLDAAELALIDQARRAGATWPEIAGALGLASRQAAEQRRARLARSASRPVDDELFELRESAADLERRLGADRRWDRRFTRAALVRETLRGASEAPAGALFDLVTAALTDLSATDVPPLPRPLRDAVDRLRERFYSVSPSDST